MSVNLFEGQTSISAPTLRVLMTWTVIHPDRCCLAWRDISLIIIWSLLRAHLGLSRPSPMTPCLWSENLKTLKWRGCWVVMELQSKHFYLIHYKPQRWRTMRYHLKSGMYFLPRSIRLNLKLEGFFFFLYLLPDLIRQLILPSSSSICHLKCIRGEEIFFQAEVNLEKCSI